MTDFYVTAVSPLQGVFGVGDGVERTEGANDVDGGGEGVGLLDGFGIICSWVDFNIPYFAIARHMRSLCLARLNARAIDCRVDVDG